MALLGLKASSGEESACQRRRRKNRGFDTWVRKIPWRRKWQLTPVFLPGIHGQKSLVGYSPWDCKELDMTEHTHTRRTKGVIMNRIKVTFKTYEHCMYKLMGCSQKLFESFAFLFEF